MNKFYILVIYKDMTLNKMWADNELVKVLLTEQKVAKVYRNTNDQEAIVVNGQVVWVDVLTTELK